MGVCASRFRSTRYPSAIQAVTENTHPAESASSDAEGGEESSDFELIGRASSAPSALGPGGSYDASDGTCRRTGHKYAYAVWRVPEAQLCGCLFCAAASEPRDLRGVHLSHRAAWRGISERLPGGRYFSGRDRLRGFYYAEEAVEAYLAEQVRHGAPEIFYHIWD